MLSFSQQGFSGSDLLALRQNQDIYQFRKESLGGFKHSLGALREMQPTCERSLSMPGHNDEAPERPLN